MVLLRTSVSLKNGERRMVAIADCHRDQHNRSHEGQDGEDQDKSCADNHANITQASVPPSPVLVKQDSFDGTGVVQVIHVIPLFFSEP